MKLTLLVSLLILSLSAVAEFWSITPSKIVTPFIDIYSSSNKKISETKMEVRVTTYSKDGSLYRGREKQEMDMAHFLKAREQSNAVFRMIPSKADSEGIVHMGTAFHIGENLVLTNQHVLSPNRSNTTECDGFTLHSSDSRTSYNCKKVHYCNVEHDVCLIEMSPRKVCKNLFCSKYTYEELKTRPALKLKAEPKMTVENMDTQVMTCIGNTMGFGIHYSQGKSFRISGGDRIFFYAPLRTGNSGGPLIGEDGLVWGVVKQESAVKVGEDAYNVAASMNKVIDLMREQITDKAVLENFNKAISE